MKARLIAAFVACLVAASGAAAHAQEGGTRGPGGIRDTSPQSRPQELSVMMYVPWWYGIGVGVQARYEIPIVPNGFIPAINDQFSLEPALSLSWQRDYDVYCRGVGNVNICGDNHGSRVGITPAVYGMWSFHISPKFRPYVALGVGVTIGVETGDTDWNGRLHNFFFDSAVGMFYRFAAPVAFRGELGAQGPKAGFSFYF